MTAREYCLTHDSVAYASMLGGIEIKGIEYGITDSVYCVYPTINLSFSS